MAFEAANKKTRIKEVDRISISTSLCSLQEDLLLFPLSLYFQALIRTEAQVFYTNIYFKKVFIHSILSDSIRLSSPPSQSTHVINFSTKLYHPRVCRYT